MKIKTPLQVVIDTEKLTSIIPDTERGHTKPYKVFVIVDRQKILVARFESPKEAMQYIDELTGLWINDEAGTGSRAEDYV